MEIYFELKKHIKNEERGLGKSCYEMVKILFSFIRPSYFKSECYNIDSVVSIDTVEVNNMLFRSIDEICRILEVVLSDRDYIDLLDYLKVNILGREIKPFYCLDCNNNGKRYSRAELFILNKVVELCYSEFISFKLFQIFADEYEFEFLDEKAGIKEKIAWMIEYWTLLRCAASSDDGSNSELITSDDLVRKNYQEFISIEKN